MRRKTSLYLDLIRWDRPAGWLLLLWPTLSALWIASDGFPGWYMLVVFTLGTVLMRSAGCCFNDVADRRFDRHVKRTAARPVTAGTVTVQEALVLGTLLVVLAFTLVLGLNVETIYWSFGALSLTLVYPYSKRFISMPQAVLGATFSSGILMAFSAVQSRVPMLAWLLILANVFWVLAYDTEYAMVDRDDDLKVGLKTSAITLGSWDVPTVLVCYLAFLFIQTIALTKYALSVAFDIALGLAFVQVVWQYTLIRTRSRAGCFKAFRLNHWLGFTLFLGIALS